jgi:hypothetical protein
MFRLVLVAFLLVPSLACAECTDLSTIGHVVSIRVTTPGDGYTNPTVTIAAPADGVAAAASAMFVPGHGLSGISMTSGGDRYEAPPKVTIADPTGTGAAAVVSEMNYAVMRACRY